MKVARLSALGTYKYHALLHLIFHIKPWKMDLTKGSETSANINQTPGKHPKFDTLIKVSPFLQATKALSESRGIALLCF
jgi:hypothetical protein